MTLDRAYVINQIRTRLTKALHSADRLAELRERVVELVCDLADTALRPTLEEQMADTVRSRTCESIPVVVELDEECAPSVPADSEVAQEYGV